MDIVARDYVKFVLEVGLYDSDFIDAYYGPEELKPAADRKEAEFPYERFKNDAEALQQRLRTIDLSAAEPILQHALAAALTFEPMVEFELEAFLTRVIDVGEPEDMPSHFPGRVVPAVFAQRPDAWQPELEHLF